MTLDNFYPKTGNSITEGADDEFNTEGIKEELSNGREYFYTSDLDGNEASSYFDFECEKTVSYTHVTINRVGKKALKVHEDEIKEDLEIRCREIYGKDCEVLHRWL